MKNTISKVDKSIEEKIKSELSKTFDSKRKRIFTKIFSTALGSIPWVGGVLSAMIDFKSEEEQVKNNELYELWLSEHSKKIETLYETLFKIVTKIDEFSDDINERLESEEYLQIVRKSFKSWDNADTHEKKELIRKLLVNSGTQTLVHDDLIRLFLDWIDLYHEIHFSIIKIIYQNPGITRFNIWEKLSGKDVKENSMEADLFKLLIRDLSMGSVIRQHREVDYYGNFVKSQSRSRGSSNLMKSAFDNNERYELTELGKYFVHYTMNDIVKKIE